MTIQLVFDIAPLPKERPRFSTRGGQVRTYTPSKTVAFESFIARSAKAQLLKLKPITGLISASLFFEFKRPKRTKLLTPKKDIDNLCKSVLDALNGVLFVDDTQVVDLLANKKWSDRDRITLVVNEVFT